MHGPQNVEFAAYIPFYAPCETRFIDDEKLSKRPVRIFHGAADDWVKVEPCQRFVERLRRAANDVQLIVYPGARHVFDNPLFQSERNFPDTEVLTRCNREERAGGEIFNVDTGKPFSLQDACVTRGATVGFDANAYGETLKAVESFVTETLKPIQSSHSH
jgi:dienelactone hydrolase